MAIKVNGINVIDDNKHCTIGSGTTAQRPSTPAIATLWFNTETDNLESYNGVVWENLTKPPGPIPPLLPSGPALAWGNGAFGRLGANDLVSRSSPVSVVGGIDDWVQVSAGNYHTAAIRSNGTAWAWGNGTLGRLGDGTITARSSPVSVVGGISNWIQVASGSNHTVALRSNGTVWAWGSNQFGQLGAYTISRSSPVTVVGGITDWIQVATGGNHNVALRGDGTAWAWGNGTSGQLGNGTVLNRSRPITVIGGFTDWTSVSAGSGHTVALRANGTAWAWGSNVSGRLGDGTITARSSPVSVVGGITDWTSISGGIQHSVALREDGTIWAWGRNVEGQLGNNTSVSSASPISVVGGITDWTSVSAGGYHNVALRANGTLWAWGNGTPGQLGNGTVLNSSSPVSVIGGITDWVYISAGNQHNVAIQSE
jgi:alpha-tubulin suppressor-like RCC1 family protein